MSSPATVPSNDAADELARPWQASLQLGFGLRAGHCRLLHNRHSGPLRLQKLLHPLCPEAAEALLLHPPGGIAGGDALEIDLDVAEGARVLVTTPGAAKWYRTSGQAARQTVALRIASGACLEWLPQESILFDGSDALQALDIELHGDAGMIGWDIVQLGRTAAGESWRSGRWRQDLKLRRDGRLLWCERADLAADSVLRQARQGLSGVTVFGTLWSSAAGWHDPELLHALRATLSAECDRLGDASVVHATATLLPHPRSLLLVRALASDAERLRTVLESAWALLRPEVVGLHAQRPRIWNT
jgi:urease accessory protein